MTTYLLGKHISMLVDIQIESIMKQTKIINILKHTHTIEQGILATSKKV